MTVDHEDEVFLDEPWITISWDGKRGCVHAEFKAFANSHEFRSCTLRIVSAIEGRRATALVSDNRRLEGVTVEDQLWLRDVWTPLAVASGLARIAVVLPHRGLGKIASEAIIGRFGEREFVTHTFESLDAAQTWIADAG